MRATISFTALEIEVPNGVQVGDKLRVAGTVTVHSVTADLVDVSSVGRREWVPGQVEISVYANEIAVRPAGSTPT